jgi:hypothetical protein
MQGKRQDAQIQPGACWPRPVDVKMAAEVAADQFFGTTRVA